MGVNHWLFFQQKGYKCHNPPFKETLYNRGCHFWRDLPLFHQIYLNRGDINGRQQPWLCTCLKKLARYFVFVWSMICVCSRHCTLFLWENDSKGLQSTIYELFTHVYSRKKLAQLQEHRSDHDSKTDDFSSNE